MRSLPLLLALAACTRDSEPSDTDVIDRGELVGVSVVPFSPTVAVGETVQFSVRGFYEDESSALLDGATWQSTEPRLVSVDAGGLASALAAGEGAVVASVQGLSARVAVTVRSAEDRAVAVRAVPAALTLTVGQQASIQAVADYPDGGEGQVAASCAWTTDDAAIATVSAGQVSAVRPGATRIEAQCGSFAPIGADVTVVSEGTPVEPADLRVSYFEATVVGNALNYEIIVTNGGRGNAGGFWVDLFANQAVTPTTEDVIDDLAWIGGLAAGASQPISLTVTELSSGSYTSWVAVDLDDRIAESNDGNNVGGPLTRSVNDQRPDLVVAAVDALTDGESTLYEIEVRNVGTAGAGGFWVDVFQDSPSNPAVDDLGDDFHWVPGLAAGASSVIEFTLDQAPLSGGTWSSVVFADTNNHVVEADEGNNLARVTVAE